MSSVFDEFFKFISLTVFKEQGHLSCYYRVLTSVCAFACGQLQNFSDFKNFKGISKITQPQCVSGHSEQLPLVYTTLPPTPRLC